jgi:predicted dehydrogenase
MRAAIIGCGLIGHKRARALAHCTTPVQVVAAVDTHVPRAQKLAETFPGCRAYTSWLEVVTQPEIDLVVVSTTNDCLALVSLTAAQHGKHVLVEKPAGRCSTELAAVQSAARRSEVLVKVGFNHRFHPAFQKARALFDAGAIGPLLYIRGRYGHGGRVGYDREWRADPAIAGGGELLDQGVHLIDLARWFAGDFASTSGHVGTFYWDMPVEDNGFVLLRTAAGQVAFLHASCTEWKNLFSFEIFGKDGKLQIDGLGGSYGVERLTWYRMLPQMGPPETTAWEYPGEDHSWQAECQHLLDCIAEGRPLSGSLEDALAALQHVEQVYAACGRGALLVAEAA